MGMHLYWLTDDDLTGRQIDVHEYELIVVIYWQGKTCKNIQEK